MATRRREAWQGAAHHGVGLRALLEGVRRPRLKVRLTLDGGFSWSNVQRHDTPRVTGVVDISDAHQFNNGIMGADNRFDVVRRNEVFVLTESEVGYTCTAQCFDCCILCRCEARRRCHRCGLVDDVAAGSDFPEVDLHTGRRVKDLGFANARGASGRSGFRARVDTKTGRGSRTELHAIAEGVSGCLISPQDATPDGNHITGTGAQGGLCTGSAQDDCIVGAVAISDDTVLGVVP
jgi:hypothetical protein